MFLARKISRAKWDAKEELSEGEISADAITADLRTQENTLSFWRCGDGLETEVEDAVLAISSACQRVDKIDIVWIDEDQLRTDGQTLQNTAGQTPVTDLVNLHVDICQLDYIRLGNVAHHVITAIGDGRWDRFSRSRVIKILLAAIEQRRVKLEGLQKNVREEIIKSLAAGVEQGCVNLEGFQTDVREEIIKSLIAEK